MVGVSLLSPAGLGATTPAKGIQISLHVVGGLVGASAEARCYKEEIERSGTNATVSIRMRWTSASTRGLPVRVQDALLCAGARRLSLCERMSLWPAHRV